MAGRLKTFWYVVTGRWPERPPGGWTVAEIQARGREHAMAVLAGCQPDELLDLVLKRSWWRTWIWPGFSGIYGRPGAKFGAAAVGSAVAGPLGAAAGMQVGGWRSSPKVFAREPAAVPDGKIVMRDLVTPFQTFMARVLLLNVVGIALFFAALLLAVALMVIDPGALDRIIAFFAGASSVPRSIQQISLDLLYFVSIFHLAFLIIIFSFQARFLYKYLMNDVQTIIIYITQGGIVLYSILCILFSFLVIVSYSLYLLLGTLNNTNQLKHYFVILLLPVFCGGVPVLLIFFPRACYVMFRIRRSGKLPDWLRLET